MQRMQKNKSFVARYQQENNRVSRQGNYFIFSKTFYIHLMGKQSRLTGA